MCTLVIQKTAKFAQKLHKIYANFSHIESFNFIVLNFSNPLFGEFFGISPEVSQGHMVKWINGHKKTR